MTITKLPKGSFPPPIFQEETPEKRDEFLEKAARLALEKNIPWMTKARISEQKHPEPHLLVQLKLQSNGAVLFTDPRHIHKEDDLIEDIERGTLELIKEHAKKLETRFDDKFVERQCSNRFHFEEEGRGCWTDAIHLMVQEAIKETGNGRDAFEKLSTMEEFTDAYEKKLDVFFSGKAAFGTPKESA